VAGRAAVEGMEGWLAADDVEQPMAPPRGVRLLPYFDAYAVGCQSRERVFPGRTAERALSRGQAGTFPVLLIDGVVTGVWHQRRAGRWLDVTVEPLSPLATRHRRRLDDAVQRIGDFLEASPRLEIGTVTTGPHA
jgi:hypothetical protein